MNYEDLLSHTRSQLCAIATASGGAPLVVETNAESLGYTHQAVVDWPCIAVRMRYLTFLDHGVEIMAWVYERFGKDDHQWQYTVLREQVTFYFRNRDQAMLFRLTWGG